MPAVQIYGDRKDRTRVSAHIPTIMHEQLTKRARRNHRTLTREIIAIVDEALQREDAMAGAHS